MLHNDLNQLRAKTNTKVMAYLNAMARDPILKGFGVVGGYVNETIRDLAVQMAYFSRSRMSVEDVKKMFKAAGLWAITDAEAKTKCTETLESKHLLGKAADIAPSKDGKTPWWNAPDEVWARMAKIAEACGLESGYGWKAFKDSPHVQDNE